MRVLILKPDHLGDFVLALPSLWELRQQLGKDAQIDVMVGPWNVEWSQILDWLPHIEPIQHSRYVRPPQAPLPLLCKLVQQSLSWRGRRYDVAVELSSTTNDWVGKVMMLLAGANERSGAVGSFDWLLSEKQDSGRGHQTQMLARRFPAKWKILGYAKPEDFMPARFRHTGRGEKILLAPWAGTDAKQWPFTSWRELVSRLNSFEVGILSPPNTEERSEAICEGESHAHVVPTTCIAETLGILAESKAVIGVDSSVAHFAWLTGTPLVELFSGTGEVGRWSSLASGEILFKKPPCAPCHLRVCPQSKNFCMTDITCEEVLEALQSALSKKDSQENCICDD